MSMHLFILGKDPELSLAELHAVYLGTEISMSSKEIALIDLKTPFTQPDLDRLGGVIKVAQVIASVSPQDLEDALFKTLANHAQGAKLNYGLSLYGAPARLLRNLLMNLKRKLKEAGVPSRFLNQDEENLSSAQFKGLGKEGVELVAFKNDKDFFIGKVVAVQDIDRYSKRDYGKPYRSMQVGMLPPKLAQILINLTGLKQGTFWDPFCGTGTLLAEGLLMGYTMLGSDIDRKMIFASEQNSEWLKKEFGLKTQAELFTHDARKPLKKPFDAIVCEGYLGPPQERKLRADQLQPLVTDLERLYLAFFKALHEAQRKGPIVIAMPFFRVHEGREIFLDAVIKKVQQFGFHPKPLLPGVFRLTYARPDQVVGRAIYRFVG